MDSRKKRRLTSTQRVATLCDRLAMACGKERRGKQPPNPPIAEKKERGGILKEKKRSVREQASATVLGQPVKRTRERSFPRGVERKGRADKGKAAAVDRCRNWGGKEEKQTANLGISRIAEEGGYLGKEMGRHADLSRLRKREGNVHLLAAEGNRVGREGSAPAFLVRARKKRKNFSSMSKQGGKGARREASRSRCRPSRFKEGIGAPSWLLACVGADEGEYHKGKRGERLCS